jgi:hypothetical protein
MSDLSSADNEPIARNGWIQVSWTGQRFREGRTLQNTENTLAERPVANSEAAKTYEFVDSRGLALRWNLPESWIRDQVRARSADPLPHIRFGKYVRFRWGSPELEAWAERRIVSSSNRVVGRALGKEST